VGVLISAGSNLETPDNDQRTPLMNLVANCDSVACVKMLISHHAKVQAVDKQRLTALSYAVMSGFTDCAQALIAAGANPSATDTQGCNGLMAAAWYGSLGCVNILIAAGVDPAAKDSSGRTAIDYAASGNDGNGYPVIVERLRSVQPGI